MTSATPHTPRPVALDYLLLLLLACLWGASYSFIKIGVATIPPITLIALRTFIAGGLLLLVLRLRRVAVPRDACTWRLFILQSLMNSVLPFVLIAWAEQTVDAGLATILNSTPPLIAYLITWAVTRHEPATGRKLFGLAVGLAGVLLIIGIEALSGLDRTMVAQLAILAASVCYAVAAIFGRNFKGMDPMLPAAGSMVSGAVLLIPASILIDRPWSLAPSGASMLALLGLSVLSTALAFVIYFRLLDRLGSVGVTSQAYLRVPIGVLIGVLLLGEQLGSAAWIGMALVVLGVAAMTTPGRRSQALRS